MPLTVEEISRLKIPFVGVGCIVTHGDLLLLVRSQTGEWGPPGGHLDFGELLEACAVRETREETSVCVTNVEFVAVTNDLLVDAGKHYVTVWMKAEAEGTALAIGDPAEIAEAGWFSAKALPTPLFPYFENLLAGRCLPAAPTNLPFAIPQIALPSAALSSSVRRPV